MGQTKWLLSNCKACPALKNVNSFCRWWHSLCAPISEWFTLWLIILGGIILPYWNHHSARVSRPQEHPPYLQYSLPTDPQLALADLALQTTGLERRGLAQTPSLMGDLARSLFSLSILLNKAEGLLLVLPITPGFVKATLYVMALKSCK